MISNTIPARERENFAEFVNYIINNEESKILTVLQLGNLLARNKVCDNGWFLTSHVMKEIFQVNYETVGGEMAF